MKLPQRQQEEESNENNEEEEHKEEGNILNAFNYKDINMSENNLRFNKLLQNMIVTENKENNKYREKEKWKVAMPKLKATLEENVQEKENDFEGEDEEREEATDEGKISKIRFKSDNEDDGE